MAERKFRNEAIKAAKDLRYGEEVIATIKEAKTQEEVSKIMCNVRNRTMIMTKPKPVQRPDFLAWTLV